MGVFIRNEILIFLSTAQDLRSAVRIYFRLLRFLLSSVGSRVWRGRWKKAGDIAALVLKITPVPVPRHA